MKKKLSHPLIGNFVSLAILQGANYILPLITVPYLFRVLNVGNYGLINFSASFVQYFIVFTDFGYNLSATKLIAETRSDVDERSRVFNRVMVSKLLLLLISFFVLTVIVFSFNKFSSDKALYFYSFGLVVGNVLFPVWFFMGMEKMKFITIITLITRVLSLAPIFLLVKSSKDYLLVPVINSAGTILSGIISLIIVRTVFKTKFYLPSFAEIKESLRDSSEYFMSRISVSLYTVSNTFVLGLFGSNTMVGYYSAAEKLFTALQNAYVPVNNALYPYMTKSRNIPLFKKIFLFVNLANILAILFLLLETRQVVYIIYKISDVPSVEVLRILLFACIIIVPSILLGYPLLGTMGYARYANLSVITSSVFHLAGLCFLVVTNTLSVYSVATMVVLTESMVFIIRTMGVRKYKLLKVHA